MTEETKIFTRFDVEPFAFSKAVEYLSKRIAERRGNIPILSYLLIDADAAGTVTLTACDLDIEAAYSLPADVREPGTFAIDGFALADVLAKVRKNKHAHTVTIQDGERRAELVSCRNRFNLQRCDGEGFPRIMWDADMAVGMAVPAAPFIADLATLEPCVSKDSNRYYLCGVAMQARTLAGRERLVTVATDGVKIGVVSRALPEGGRRMRDSLIPLKAVQALRWAIKEDASEAMTVENDTFKRECGTLRFTLGAITITARAIDGTFPAWEGIFDESLAPTGEALPMFPELMPAAPLKDMQTIEKAVKAPVAWEIVRDGMLGTVPGDDGMLFGTMRMTDKMAAQPVKGFHIEFTADSDAAHNYLLAIADQNAGREVPRCHCAMFTRHGEVLGMTVGERTWIDARYEEFHNWETLVVEKRLIEGHMSYADGAHSLVMPRDKAKLRPDVSLHIDGDATVYPMGVNAAGTIHLNADQVRNIVGESCFEVMALTIAGRAVYILQWLYDQGDSRFLTVRADGRCFKGKDRHLAQYLTRDQVDAALRGEIAETVEVPALSAPVATQDDSAPSVGDDKGEAVATLSEAESCPAQLSEDAGQLPDAGPVEVPAATPVDNSGDISPSVAQALLARIEALEALVASQPAATVSIVESVPAPANDDSQPRRVRTEGERRAIIRAWRMRQAMRAQADLDMRALQKVSADNRFILETLHKSEERVAELERKVIEAKALVDAAEAENVASVTRMSRQAKEMVDVMRADLAAATQQSEAMERFARAAELRADNAEGRAMRMVRAASGYRTRMRRAGEDLRGARAEARALARRLDEARRTISESAPIVPPAGNTLAAAFASALT